MTALSMLTLLVTHPREFRTLVQFWVYHEQKRDIAAQQEHPTSGWDREDMRICWKFLDQTSRSFSAVIKELDGDLARTICLFYLVLRGLDTIEDDMTIPDKVKQPILRSFHEKVVTPEWSFDGCGPNEKDRNLLVQYNHIVNEVNLLLPEYKSIIIDICEKMENGMADFAHKAATSGFIYLDTVADYDLYCHYVAGLVGEGLSRIFSASKKEVDWLGEQFELSNSMGLLLQKTNIIRDYREDVEQKRFFWPKELWGKKVFGFNEMHEMCQGWDKDPTIKQRAMWVQTAMVVDALRHTTDALDYLRLLRNQSVFNFCAIPASMAIATLSLCFMNPTMFERNIKIRKAEAARLIMRSTNPRDVAYIFRDYSRSIHARADPADPSFLKLSVACARIEQWCEHAYPSFIKITTGPDGRATQTIDATDVRSRVVEIDAKFDHDRTLPKPTKGGAITKPTTSPPLVKPNEGVPWDIVGYVSCMLLSVCILCVVIVWAILWAVGEETPGLDIVIKAFMGQKRPGLE